MRPLDCFGGGRGNLVGKCVWVYICLGRPAGPNPYHFPASIITHARANAPKSYLLEGGEEGLGDGDDREEVHLHDPPEVLHGQPVDQPRAGHACVFLGGWGGMLYVCLWFGWAGMRR